MANSTSGSGTTDVDVVVVGYGPVGQVLSILLAQQGWRVAVIERWLDQYPFPRVVAFDGETSRTLAAAGIGDALPRITEPLGAYDFQNSAGQTLLHLDLPYSPGHSGWPPAVVIHQPTLQETLHTRVEELSGLRVLRGHRAERLVDHGDHVELLAPGPVLGNTPITASWVVGCDGANSFVREHLGTTVSDLGFQHDWLLADLVFKEEREFTPTNTQLCDPARPTTLVASGGGHRRWEFMRLPGETVEELEDVDTVWKLLAPFDVTPENAELCHHTVYTFQGRLTDDWRAGRVVLAGDAAHVMPPFAGQGMCSGVQDAANLAWKLDLVLRGVADERVLDSYQAERRRHVANTINGSIELGKLISELDPVAAGYRDAGMLELMQDADHAAMTPHFYPLEEGILRRDADGARILPAGDLVPQARVARGDRVGLFDDVVGRGFVLLTTVDPHPLPDDDLAFLKEIGAHVVRLRPMGTDPGDVAEDEVVDIDDVYFPYFDDLGDLGALVRPDFYLFGTMRSPSDLSELVGALRSQLQ
ncbi:MAG: bifunctional 3-(3-hydroxy-phenyl)propionate/3-hydroxycinnamic acid hydroxylase [Umezawaea sp.]